MYVQSMTFAYIDEHVRIVRTQLRSRDWISDLCLVENDPLSCVGKNSALRNLIVFNCANIIRFNKQMAGIDSEKISALRYSKIEISYAVQQRAKFLDLL